VGEDSAVPDVPAELTDALADFSVGDRWLALDEDLRQRVVAWVVATENTRVRRSRRIAGMLAANLQVDAKMLARYESEFLRRHPEERGRAEAATDGPITGERDDPRTAPPRNPGRYELLELLDSEWAENDPSPSPDDRRAIVRLWAAGLITQDLLHVIDGRHANTPVALSRDRSLEAAWEEMQHRPGEINPDRLRRSLGVGEHVLSLLVAAQGFPRMGCVVLTKMRALYVPLADTARPPVWAWSVALDDVSGVTASRSRTSVRITLETERAYASEPLRMTDQDSLGAYRLAFRLRHALRWRSSERVHLREQLAADIDECVETQMLDQEGARTALALLGE
jgi:hypothetical protein